MHAAGPARGSASDDWLVYKHWDSGRGRLRQMTDFTATTATSRAKLNEIKDVGMEARVTLSESMESISVALARDSIASCSESRPAGGEIELLRNGQAASACKSL